MADTSFVEESAATLAAFLTRIKVDEDARRRVQRRIVAAAGVTVLHLAFIVMLIQAEWIPGLRVRPPVQGPLLWLLLQHAPGASKIAPEHKRKATPRAAVPTTIIQPIITQSPPSNAITDFGLALGRALACGASSFEYLTPEGRAQCRRVPWHFKYDRYGVIVLDTETRPEEPKPRPGDIMAHERNTQPVCPTYVDPSAPCISSIIHGGGPQ